MKSKRQRAGHRVSPPAAYLGPSVLSVERLRCRCIPVGTALLPAWFRGGRGTSRTDCDEGEALEAAVEICGGIPHIACGAEDAREAAAGAQDVSEAAPCCRDCTLFKL